MVFHISAIRCLEYLKYRTLSKLTLVCDSLRDSIKTVNFLLLAFIYKVFNRWCELLYYVDCFVKILSWRIGFTPQ